MPLDVTVQNPIVSVFSKNSAALPQPWVQQKPIVTELTPEDVLRWAEEIV